ncbi:hypothetical protein BDV59DRAFT_173590 [Aspergillus ambiguus]|uniref:GIY-YIG nuclease family protein n=1 Tax=Aspergillus ambiguus TaxID=176160 RepID=UPI003CCCB99C
MHRLLARDRNTLVTDVAGLFSQDVQGLLGIPESLPVPELLRYLPYPTSTHTAGVYGIIGVSEYSNALYIGCSIDLPRRLRSHRRNIEQPCSPELCVHRVLSEPGWNIHYRIILSRASMPRDLLFLAETITMVLLDTVEQNGNSRVPPGTTAAIEDFQKAMEIERTDTLRLNKTLSIFGATEIWLLSRQKPDACEVCGEKDDALIASVRWGKFFCRRCQQNAWAMGIPDTDPRVTEPCFWCKRFPAKEIGQHRVHRRFEGQIYCMVCLLQRSPITGFPERRKDRYSTIICACVHCDQVLIQNGEFLKRSRLIDNVRYCDRCGMWKKLHGHHKEHLHFYGECQCQGCPVVIYPSSDAERRLHKCPPLGDGWYCASCCQHSSESPMNHPHQLETCSCRGCDSTEVIVKGPNGRLCRRCYDFWRRHQHDGREHAH